jgi:molecular chaperone GrpE (heat shock protein)
MEEKEPKKEIKKALEWLSKYDLVHWYIDGYQPKTLAFKDILNLIVEQQEEIERLKEFEKASPDILKLFQENTRLKAEIERLMKELEIAKGTKNRLTIFDRIEIHDKAVKDTAKEMIEEIDNVKEIFPNDIVGYEQAQGWLMCIDKLKEIAKLKGAKVE